MNLDLRSCAFVCGILFALTACNSNSQQSTGLNTNTSVQTAPATANPSEFAEFVQKFKPHALPYALPTDIKDDKDNELDKKYVKDLLTQAVTPAFGSEDVLPGIADNIDAAKYHSCASLKLDSFTGYIIHKEGDDDYYFLYLFDKSGKCTDGMCIAFTEGSNDDGTIREAAINDDGSIEISQSNVQKGKADNESAERHFYEITVDGKIHDLKSNANPSNT